MLTRGGRKGHFKEDWCYYAPSCFTKQQQASVASYPLRCRDAPEFLQYALAWQTNPSFFPGYRSQTHKNKVQDQYTTLEQAVSIEKPGPNELERARVESKQLSMRAELASLGYSLWDLSPEVVARAMEDPHLTEQQKEIVFQKLQYQTEKSIRKVLAKEAGKSNL